MDSFSLKRLTKERMYKGFQSHSMGVVMYVKYTFLFILSGGWKEELSGHGRSLWCKYKSCLADVSWPPPPPPPPPPPQPSRPILSSTEQHTQTEAQRAEHKHLDHTNKFYFLMADRRTRRTAAANPSPPPPPPIIHDRETDSKKERVQDRERERKRGRGTNTMVKMGLILLLCLKQDGQPTG